MDILNLLDFIERCPPDLLLGIIAKAHLDLVMQVQ